MPTFVWNQVVFVDEVAVDEGGLRKEFFQLISHDLLNPQYGMFKEYSESRLIWFNDDPLVRCSTFRCEEL